MLNANCDTTYFYQQKLNTVKPMGYTNLSCTKSWIIRTFCPVPAKSPLIPYIKSLTMSCTNLSYTKPGLYNRFSRSQPKIYWFIRISGTALRGKIAHFSTFSLFCFNSNADFFSISLTYVSMSTVYFFTG